MNLLDIASAIRCRIRQRADARIDPYPHGCCECGTGGPYYRGDQTPVVRYLYSGACYGTPPGEIDWASCSQHRLTGIEPVIDYGRDLPKTIGEVRADIAALATREN